MTERVHFGDLVAFQSSGEAWCTTYAVKLKHSTENLAHDFGRQLDSKGACHPVASQVVVLEFAMDVDSLWIGEYMGLWSIHRSVSKNTLTVRGTYILAGMSEINKDALPLEESEGAYLLVG